MSIAAGFLFGAWGVPVVIVSATSGATIAFFIARYIVRGRVRALARKRPVLNAVDNAVTQEGWKIILLLRLNPLVPFGLQNYFFGATSIRLLPYVISSFFGIIPGAAMYVYLGALARVATNTGAEGPLKLAFLAIGLAATAVTIFIVGHKAKAMLSAKGVADGRPPRTRSSRLS